MNPGTSIVDRGSERAWLSAKEATKLLGVKAATLYSYASRGLVRTASSGAGSRRRLYHKDDLARLSARSRARAGHGAVAAGALRWGEPVLETRIGAISAERGPIYRGKAAVDLAREGARFEDVCTLLWDDAPFAPERELSSRRLGVPLSPLRALVRGEAEPFEGMLVAAAALSTLAARGETREAARSGAALLLRRLVAACALSRGADAVAAAIDANGVARSLLVALGGRTTSAAATAMNEALVLAADHELNPSTFAARVASSSGASLASSLVAALAVLSGPLHGGATARVEAFAREVGRPERAADAVAARLDRGEPVPGFGHPLYPQGDPRGARLLEVATKIGASNKDVRVLVSVTRTMDLVAREHPTIDTGLVALSGALGLPRGAPLAIFACGRLAGMIAHALEQRDAGYMLRPRARYVGP